MELRELRRLFDIITVLKEVTPLYFLAHCQPHVFEITSSLSFNLLTNQQK